MKIADQASAQFQRAYSTIPELRPGDSFTDAVAEFLDALARRVESGVTKDAGLRESGVPPLAAAVSQGITGQPTDDYLQLDSLTTITLQWDLNLE